MSLKLNRELNISQLIGIVVLIVGGLGGYFNLWSNVEAHGTKIITLQVDKLDQDLYEKDMEVLDEVVVELKKLTEEVTKLRVDMAKMEK